MSAPTHRPKAILFDWDNTLVDSWPTIHRALEPTFRAMGQEPWSLEETKNRVRESLRESFPKLFGGRWEEAGRIFYENYEACHLERLTECPEARELLEGIASLGIYMGVISNKTGRLLRAESEKLGWTGYFGALIGATDAAQDKPALDPLFPALQPSGLAPGEHVWYVGDTELDMGFALGAGCVAILLRDTQPEKDEFSMQPPACYFGGGLK